MIAPGDTEQTFTSTYDQTEQPYRIFLPGEVGLKPLPLLVVLHGKTVDHNAWFEFTPVKEAAAAHEYVVACPYGRGDYWYRGPAEQDVLDIIADVKARVQIDENRVYLMGHSMGGWGTSWIGLRHPDVFAAICPMSGWAPDDLLGNGLWLRPFLIHDVTDPIVPVGNLRQATAGFAREGVSVRYREEHGYGHGSAMIGDNFPRLFDWIDQYRRPAVPSRIQFATRTPRAGSAYWVRIFETADFPVTAIIKAEIVKPGRIEVQTAGVRQFAVELTSLEKDPNGRIALTVDGEEVDVPAPNGWILMTRVRKGSPWMSFHAQSEADLPEYASPPAKLPWDEHIPDDDQEKFTNAYGNLIREQTEADVALFRRDMFRDAGWPMTIDRLIDTYVYPVEDLAHVRVGPQAFLEELAENDQYLVVTPEFERRDGKRVLELGEEPFVVLTTADIAKLFEPNPVILPLRPDQYLIQAMKNLGN